MMSLSTEQQLCGDSACKSGCQTHNLVRKNFPAPCHRPNRSLPRSLYQRQVQPQPLTLNVASSAQARASRRARPARSISAPIRQVREKKRESISKPNSSEKQNKKHVFNPFCLFLTWPLLGLVLPPIHGLQVMLGFAVREVL